MAGRRVAIPVLLVIAFVVIALSACSGGTDATPASTPSVVVAPTPAPSVTEQAIDISARDFVLGDDMLRWSSSVPVEGAETLAKQLGLEVLYAPLGNESTVLGLAEYGEYCFVAIAADNSASPTRYAAQIMSRFNLVLDEVTPYVSPNELAKFIGEFGVVCTTGKDVRPVETPVTVLTF